MNIYEELGKWISHIDTVKSKQDNTIKYVFKQHNSIFEIAYINKNDGRNILCVPTQTMCTMGCTFCHTTDYLGKIKKENLCAVTITKCCYYILQELNLLNSKDTTYISFMGIGEPLENIDCITETMKIVINGKCFGKSPKFAMATCIPKHCWTELIILGTCFSNPSMKDINPSDLKIHFSMHYTTDEVRKEYMPKALNLETSFKALDLYENLTGAGIEIHYAMIAGVNDTMEDLDRLKNFVKDTNYRVKFLQYNEREALGKEKATISSIDTFKSVLKSYNIETTYYIPPGLDVGASCGQFLMDHYIKNSSKESENEV